MRRLAAAGLGVTLLAVATLLATASPAAAHAVLLSTSPADRAQLSTPPGAVSLEFSENVSAALGAVRVFDRDGTHVDEGAVRVIGSKVRVALQAGLGDGAYVATYRVLSADSHPVTRRVHVRGR